MSSITPTAFWSNLCSYLELPELAASERYNTSQKRSDYADELIPKVDAALKRRTASEWVELMNGQVPCSANRGKRAIVIDLKSAEGKALLLRMLEKSDVLVENFRPSVPARLGIDYETLRVTYPRLIDAQKGPALPLHSRRIRSLRVPLRRLDFDDVRPEVGKQGTGVRA